MSTTAPQTEALAGLLSVMGKAQQSALEQFQGGVKKIVADIAESLTGSFKSTHQTLINKMVPLFEGEAKRQADLQRVAVQVSAPMQAAFARVNRLERNYPKAFTLALSGAKGEIEALETRLEQGFSYEMLDTTQLHLALFIGIDNKLPWLVHGVILELARRRVALFVALLQMFKKDVDAQKLRATFERFAITPARAPPIISPLEYRPQTQTNAPNIAA